MARPLLLCFDGSSDATQAIAEAGRLLAPRPAVVLTVWESVNVWEAYDPGALLSAGVGKLASGALGLDEIGRELAQEKQARGVELAVAAGFDATGRIVEGKAWRAIVDVARELDAAAIILGARGLSRVQSLLLGGVSSGVVVHADRPVVVVPPGSADEDPKP